ncbi:ESX-1 secretion-associated protein [Streptomyces sp. NRRL F-5755]|uniref:ESX-1 secretion-associated protein n=1 Tax=Streptomyces sp. NRRL F-5755 TaxID=1519475 RepID=UPI000AD776BE|nr:ESX-1 secretion-associated protein [Streptomyces sp. NRRL F-5755]
MSHDFKQVGKRLEGKVSTFASTAESVDGAFGVLSESTEALAKYVEMTQATVESLKHLREQLAGYAAGLEHNAAGYEHTDAQHAAGFRGE